MEDKKFNKEDFDCQVQLMIYAIEYSIKEVHVSIDLTQKKYDGRKFFKYFLGRKLKKLKKRLDVLNLLIGDKEHTTLTEGKTNGH